MTIDPDKLTLEDRLYLGLPWAGTSLFAEPKSWDPPKTGDKEIDKITSSLVANHPTEASLIAARDLNNYLDAYWQDQSYDRREPRGLHDSGNLLEYNGESLLGPRSPYSQNRDYVYNKVLDNLVLNQNRKGKQLSNSPFMQQIAEDARNPERMRNLPVTEKTYPSNPSTRTGQAINNVSASTKNGMRQALHNLLSNKKTQRS